MDAPVIGNYISVTASDGSLTDVVKPFTDSEYTSWDSEEEISETQFGSMTPEIAEMSAEDGCVSEPSIADPRLTQGCNTNHRDGGARKRVSGQSLAERRRVEFIATVPPSKTMEESTIYDARSLAMKRMSSICLQEGQI